MSERKLKPGDVVEVRSPAEILATLDGEASIDRMPFMGEMLQHAGKRFTVSHRVEKICDTVSGEAPNSRRMRDTVLLDDLRCDGSAHGGCQAGCRIYWKEAWLRRVSADVPPANADGGALARLEELVAGGGRAAPASDEVSTVYRCQATEALRASEPLNAFDFRQYARELEAGNVGLVRFLRVAAHALGALIGRRLHGVRRRLGLLDERPTHLETTPVPVLAALNLQPGDMVEVRSAEEIAPGLDGNSKLRGLHYDKPEMGVYGGGRYRVQERVERIIDERTGRMIEISSDCLILEGVVCSGDHSVCRWFCPRGIYPYWREAWLRRLDDPAADSVEP